MRILFVSSEMHPLAKSGGLADAVAALAAALAERGHEVAVLLPRYPETRKLATERLPEPLGVPMGGAEHWTSLHRGRIGDVELLLLEHNELYDRDGLYGHGGKDWPDNLRRFALLSRAALQVALGVWKPDVIHCHDWQSALVPVFHRTRYAAGPLAALPVVYSIHNFGYQGIFGHHESGILGLTDDELQREGVLSGTTVNLMRGALFAADRILTVSPRYALEIQEPAYAYGLHREIGERAEDVSGILNGIDENDWDPGTDALITAPYTVRSLGRKGTNKRALQRSVGLAEAADVPLIGMVTRLADQKGIGPLFGAGYGAIARICSELPVQIVLLGSGESWCEEEVETLNRRFANFAAVIGYDNALAHQIEAGSDFFLMPSIYEPCGLNQMYSMRYGTIPIVTRTGGLADSVDDETGFFIDAATPEEIFATVAAAVELFGTDPKAITAMRRAGMKRDFSWRLPAAAYEAVYESLIDERRR